MAVSLIDFKPMAHRLVGGLARHAGVFGATRASASALLILWMVLWYVYRKTTFLRV